MCDVIFLELLDVLCIINIPQVQPRFYLVHSVVCFLPVFAEGLKREGRMLASQQEQQKRLRDLQERSLARPLKLDFGTYTVLGATVTIVEARPESNAIRFAFRVTVRSLRSMRFSTYLVIRKP